MLVDGTTWRAEMVARNTLQGAWFMAALGRQSRIPDLKRFMRECFPLDPNSLEAAIEMEEAWRGWAARNGLKVQKLDKAVH